MDLMDLMDLMHLMNPKKTKRTCFRTIFLGSLLRKIKKTRRVRSMIPTRRFLWGPKTIFSSTS